MESRGGSKISKEWRLTKMTSLIFDGCETRYAFWSSKERSGVREASKAD